MRMELANTLDTRPAVRAVASRLYADAPRRARALQTLRPFICPLEELIRWIPSEGRLLDIGCGAGLFMGLVGTARPEISAIGFDADVGAVAAAQGMARRHFADGRIAFHHSAVGDPWPDGSFDVVSIIDVLHHIPPAHQHQVIVEAVAHVAPGGLFLYKDMIDSTFRAWWNRFHDIVVARQWIHYRPIAEVATWVTAQGAELVERGERNLGLYGHQWIVARKPGGNA